MPIWKNRFDVRDFLVIYEHIYTFTFSLMRLHGKTLDVHVMAVLAFADTPTVPVKLTMGVLQYSSTIYKYKVEALLRYISLVI